MQNINVNTIEYTLDEAKAIQTGFNSTLPAFTIAYDSYLNFIEQLLLEYPETERCTYNLFGTVSEKFYNELFNSFVNGTTEYVYVTIFTKSESTNTCIWNVSLSSLENTEVLTIH